MNIILLVASKITARDIKKSTILLAVGLPTAIAISVGMYLFFSKVTLDQRYIYVEITLLVSLVSSVAVSLITVIKLGLKSKEGRYYLSLFIAMVLWLSAESIWGYSQIILQIGIPYPSTADFFWLLGYAFLGYHFYYSFKVWKQAKVIKRISIIIAVIVSTILIGSLIYLSLQTSADEEFDIVTTIVSVLYLVGNGILLVPAIVIMWSLRRKDFLLLHRILLSSFIIINMLGDVGFAYHEILVDEDAFAQQEWVWPMVYLISYLVLIAGLIWFNKISGMINKNIQSAIDEQYPDLERLWKRTVENSESTNSENEKEYTEYQINKEVNQKIINILETAREEILFLTSTGEMFFKIKNEMYRFMKIINARDIDARILIPESSKSPEVGLELGKFPRINIQYLYKSLNENFALFIIDAHAILSLKLGRDDSSLENDTPSLFYSNKEQEVQSYIALFERCWILPIVHEKISRIYI